MSVHELMPLLDGLRVADIPGEIDRPLAPLTTFRIGGPAALLAQPRTIQQLLTTLRLWREEGGGCPMLLIGRGSDMLCPDEGYPGLVICTRSVQETIFLPQEDGSTILRTSCGTPLPGLSRRCVDASPALSGLEFACGIPGTVGGGVIMNAGAHGGEMSQIVEASRYYDLEDGQIHSLTRDRHEFSYRHSVYQDHPNWILLDADLCLTPGDPDIMQETIRRYMDARKKAQPLDRPSAGSVFRRPDRPGMYVGRMVEECGLKGYKIGGAQVSEKHAGFIIDRGGATARDVRELIRYVQDCVYERYGIELEPELCIIREDGTREGRGNG